MPKRKCSTPKCRGNVTRDNKYCWACEKKVRRDMAESGYLTNIIAQEYQLGPKPPSERNKTYSGKQEENIRVSREFPATQLTGAMLPSVKQKKRKAG